ncbi:uncharacterized protein LOC141577962 isoform X2 [Camelus bactrianus]|uniref:Uncharacterized protein LOC141577962 isoform X2 n=1 Tax=Camelus bactrianus TaxID=9837 RepID=A0AC58QIS1_CAMBA
MWRGAADAVPGTEAAWAPPDKVRGSAELALPGKKLLLAPSFCFFSSPGGFGFFDIILKLAPTGPCSSGSGSDSSSGTEREQNKSRNFISASEFPSSHEPPGWVEAALFCALLASSLM